MSRFRSSPAGGRIRF